MKGLRFVLAVVLAIGALPSVAMALVDERPAEAQEAAVPSDQRQIVARVEDWLNGFRTLKARFLQVAPDGSVVEGDAYLARPGRLRFEYDEPSPILIVADGMNLIYRDEEMDQTSYVPLQSTPAGVLVRRNVRLDGSGGVKVVGVHRDKGVVGVTVVQTSDPGAGELTLLFSEQPFTLRQWRMKDAQGQVTTVSLFDIQKNVRINPSLFRFADPGRFHDR